MTCIFANKNFCLKAVEIFLAVTVVLMWTSYAPPNFPTNTNNMIVVFSAGYLIILPGLFLLHVIRKNNNFLELYYIFWGCLFNIISGVSAFVWTIEADRRMENFIISTLQLISGAVMLVDMCFLVVKCCKPEEPLETPITPTIEEKI